MSLAIPTGGGFGFKPVNVREINLSNEYTTPTDGSLDAFDGTEDNNAYNSYARRVQTTPSRSLIYLSPFPYDHTNRGKSTGMPNEFTITTDKPSIFFIPRDWLMATADVLYDTSPSNYTTSDKDAYQLIFGYIKVYADDVLVYDGESNPSGDGYDGSTRRMQAGFHSINVINGSGVNYLRVSMASDDYYGYANGNKVYHEATGNDIGMPFFAFSKKLFIRVSFHIDIMAGNPTSGGTQLTFSKMTLDNLKLGLKGTVVEYE